MKYRVFHGLFAACCIRPTAAFRGQSCQSYGGLWLQRNALQLGEIFYSLADIVKRALIKELGRKQNVEKTSQ
ncbi:hypothetical protein [Hymenobacter properus]|uniref:Uncharacterized protein n=1 Tax=Hymenobacter properus TaxID=2791026 RepID=A0A931BGG8_9BACT|nr:hypothetical protein [Hymenobacter properus]MBF9141857.1 hypothetical protein [Hymenobacter properus]MBR7720665.1 hypothetical protein [Microvirga sp. SRT04]